MEFLEPNSLAQPEWNDAQSVHRAFERVRSASSAPESHNAYNVLLFALGNNHAGTYYPVVLAAVPLMKKVLLECGEWPQRAVLEALIDLCTSFGPARGYDYVALLPGEPPRSLSSMMRDQVIGLEGVLEPIAESRGPAGKSARELLAVLRKDQC